MLVVVVQRAAIALLYYPDTLLHLPKATRSKSFSIELYRSEDVSGHHYDIILVQVYKGVQMEVRFWGLEEIGRDETARGHLNAILKSFGPRGPTKGDKLGQEDLVPYLKSNLVAMISGKFNPTLHPN